MTENQQIATQSLEAGDDLALRVEYLPLAVDPQASIGVVPHRANRGGVKRRFVDLVHRRILAAPEVGVGACVHVRVPLAHRLREALQRHPLELVALLDLLRQLFDGVGAEEIAVVGGEGDRKSTRLNSSHLGISYAVFCLKKKKKQNKTHIRIVR